MNRIIPDFSKNRAVNSLSPLAEIFFRRLWNKADDFGRYWGDEMILKAELFPLKEIRTPDLRRALLECERAALLVQYTAEGEKLLSIRNFNQRVRRAKSNFPPPPEDCPTNDGQLSVNCQSTVSQVSDSCPPEEEVEDEEEKKKKQKECGGRSPRLDILSFLPQNFAESEDFAKAWNDWLAYRRERKLGMWVQATLKSKAKEFVEWGLEATIANINYSIGNGYQGIFAQKSPGPSPKGGDISLEELKRAYKHKVNFYDPMFSPSDYQLKALNAEDIESFKRYLGPEFYGLEELARELKAKKKGRRL